MEPGPARRWRTSAGAPLDAAGAACDPTSAAPGVGAGCFQDIFFLLLFLLSFFAVAGCSKISLNLVISKERCLETSSKLRRISDFC